MEQLSIFSATLGLSPPWQVTAASFARDRNRLDIHVEYANSAGHDCPSCGGAGTGCLIGTVLEIWYHGDFFRYATYLHAKVPLLACPCGATFHLERPWSRAGSRFCLLQEHQ